MLVRGYVTSVNQHGVFIKLARNLSVRASNREISDNASVSAEQFLTTNTMVLGRIFNFFKDKVNITLRESITTYGIDEVDISEITTGHKAKLLVLSIAANMAFCQIIGSRFKCKVKLTKEDPTVKVGDKIIARIATVSTDSPPRIMMHEVDECNEEMTEEYQNLIDLINEIKAVQQEDFENKDVIEASDKGSEVNINLDEVDQNIEDLQELLHVGDESDEDIDGEAQKITSFLNNEEHDDSQDEHMQEDSEVEADGEGDFGEGDDGEGDNGEGDEDEEVEEGEGNVEEGKINKTKKEKSNEKSNEKSKKSKSMHQHIQDEIQTMLKERGMTEEEHDEDYYEKMIVPSPDNSFLWIHYISHVLKKKGYDDAKILCERAVKTMDITNLKEKLNLWIAYMNLESRFGSEKEFQKIVKRGLKINDKKEVYLAVIDIYRKRKNYKIIEGIFIILSRKYNFHLDIWKKYIEYLFEAHSIQNDDEHPDYDLLVGIDLTEKEKLLSKAIQILDRKQQIELIRKYASEEYKYGNVEKGRTMYESIIHSYPKRTDILSTYLDLEVKFTKNKKNVRKLFDKMLAKDDIKLKQIKFLFKRYLEFETEHGSENDVNKVKEKAAEFANRFAEDGQEGEGSESESDQAPDKQEENEGDAEGSQQNEDQEMAENSEDSE
jgi:rRNA biogenesis protein RRP5